MNTYYESELCHHGIKGQKWGIRRYQNPDGSYTKAGILRYASDRDLDKIDRRIRTSYGKKKALRELESAALSYEDEYKQRRDALKEMIQEVATRKLDDLVKSWVYEHPGDYWQSYYPGNKDLSFNDYRKLMIKEFKTEHKDADYMQRGWYNVLTQIDSIKINDIKTGTDLIDVIDRAFTDPKKPKKG